MKGLVGQFSNEIYKAFKRRNPRKLRKIKSKLTRITVIEQTKELFDLALLAYILSKILSKNRYMSREFSGKFKTIEDELRMLPVSKDEREQQRIIDEVLNQISNMDAEHRRYVIDLIYKGRVKIGSSLYANGLSLSRAAALAEVEKFELMDYAGHTLLAEKIEEKIPLKKRFRDAEQILLGG